MDNTDPIQKATQLREFTDAEKRVLKKHCEDSHLAFTRYFFRIREGGRFKVSPHHIIMAKTLDRVLSGEITRLIINVPPGYTKTEMAVLNFIAHGLAINPASKFIHASYADQLALLNSSFVRDIVAAEEFQELWPMEMRTDSKSKKSWYNEKGGGLLAVSSGGTITGFRAGRMMEGFSGAFIIDDPVKPDDAYSQILRDKVNLRFTNTFKSRLAHEEVPIIVIMQRIHEDDPTGFLLKGGTGDMWHHLLLPVIIQEEPEPYPKDFTHGIPIEHGLEPGVLWPYKHEQEHIDMMEKADPYTTASQYHQRPSPIGGGLFKESWWKFYETLPNVEYKIITADTAQKVKEHNDWSVFQCWGVFDGNLYLIDQIRGKWEAPSLRVQFAAFWRKHYGSGNQTIGRLRSAYIEDKVSGTGLIQDIRKDPDTPIPIVAVQRNIDKITRAMDMAPYIASGYVWLPDARFEHANTDADFLSDYLSEFSKFTPTMTHQHDDQIDPTLDAIAMTLRPADKEAGTW